MPRDIFELCKDGLTKKLISLVENNPQIIHLRDYDDNTPLHIAAASSHEDVCELLIKNGADVNAKNRFGQTPLRYAIEWAIFPFGVIKTLVKYGADINNEQNDNGYHPILALMFSYAFRFINERHIKELIDELNIKLPENTLYETIIHNEYSMFQIVMERCTPEMIQYRDRHGNSIVHAAVNRLTSTTGYIEDIINKLGGYIDINSQNVDGNTPLHLAVINERFDMAAILVEAGADINIKNNNGLTPIDILLEVIKKGIPDYKEEFLVILMKFISKRADEIENEEFIITMEEILLAENL